MGFTIADFVRVWTFVVAVAIVYGISILWVVDRLRRRPPRSRFEHTFRSAAIGLPLLAAAVIGLGCMAYGFFIEPFRLTVTRYEIETPKLPPGARVRIVHLSDLHARGKGPRERELPGLVQSLQPDLILHSGDFFGGEDQAIEKAVVEVAKSWSTPQYTCEGNLDILADFDKTMREAGITVLNGRTVEERSNNARLTISGFVSGAENIMPKCLKTLPADAFNIVLYHHPQGFPQTWNTPADLMLAGHTHGGQIRMPWYGALITLDKYGKRWESGHFLENNVHLIVSRGLGGEPHTPEVRFLCRPEVIVIDLLGQA